MCIIIQNGRYDIENNNEGSVYIGGIAIRSDPPTAKRADVLTDRYCGSSCRRSESTVATENNAKCAQYCLKDPVIQC